MKKFSLLFLLAALSKAMYSQVPKKVVVEHFTNTKCSVCASRNPGFYTNYSAQTGVIHLAVHPSSPYSACVLSQHNASENDARTNYYGIYGSTPRLVIQGAVISSGTNYGSASIFTPYMGQQSPASIKIVQSKYGNDSIRSRLVIKTEAAHTLPGLSLFVALAEDTLNYTGSNGEPVHYDVFRKSLTGANGIAITLPATVGDSVVYTKSSTVHSAWNFSKIFTLAILQETASKAVVQAQSVPSKMNTVVTSLNDFNLPSENFTTRVLNNTITVNQKRMTENLRLSIHDLLGKLVFTQYLESETENVSLSSIPAGIYVYSIKSKNETLKSEKLILQP